MSRRGFHSKRLSELKLDRLRVGSEEMLHPTTARLLKVLTAVLFVVQFVAIEPAPAATPVTPFVPIPSAPAATPCVLDPGTSLYGQILAMWRNTKNPASDRPLHEALGCLVRPEEETPEEVDIDTHAESSDPRSFLYTPRGLYADFENGQIVWSPDQRMTIAAYVDPTNVGAGVQVQWNITDPGLHYNYVKVHWDVDARDHDNSWEVKAIWGYASLPLGPDGRRRITLEGCDNGAWPNGDPCRQGKSVPVYVDVHQVDVAHWVDGLLPLNPALTFKDTPKGWLDRLLVAANRSAGSSGDFWDLKFDDGFVNKALGKLVMAQYLNLGSCPLADSLVQEVNGALSNAKQNAHVGTDSCPGDLGPGNYDMTLAPLVTLMYEFGQCLRRSWGSDGLPPCPERPTHRDGWGEQDLR
jgi:hypothetical protein